MRDEVLSLADAFLAAADFPMPDDPQSFGARVGLNAEEQDDVDECMERTAIGMLTGNENMIVTGLLRLTEAFSRAIERNNMSDEAAGLLRAIPLGGVKAEECELAGMPAFAKMVRAAHPGA